MKDLKLDINNPPATVTTISGAQVDLFNPDPATIHLADIAFALGRIRRYNGHSALPVTVAAHSLLCGYLAVDVIGQEREDAIKMPDGGVGVPMTETETRSIFTVLMHDAAEAYIGDLIRPVKYNLEPGYSQIESAIEAAIALKFGLIYPMPAIVKTVDNLSLAHEVEFAGVAGDNWVGLPEINKEGMPARYLTYLLAMDDEDVSEAFFQLIHRFHGILYRSDSHFGRVH